jgi:hypothetical protein
LRGARPWVRDGGRHFIPRLDGISLNGGKPCFGAIYPVRALEPFATGLVFCRVDETVSRNVQPEIASRAPRQRDVADAGRYREDAALLRRRAQGADDGQLRQDLIKIAEQYEWVADAIDVPWRR